MHEIPEGIWVEGNQPCETVAFGRIDKGGFVTRSEAVFKGEPFAVLLFS